MSLDVGAGNAPSIRNYINFCGGAAAFLEQVVWREAGVCLPQVWTARGLILQRADWILLAGSPF